LKGGEKGGEISFLSLERLRGPTEEKKGRVSHQSKENHLRQVKVKERKKRKKGGGKSLYF